LDRDLEGVLRANGRVVSTRPSEGHEAALAAQVVLGLWHGCKRLSVDDNLVAMKRHDRDPGVEVLLKLDGQVFVVDTKGQYWVRFSVSRVVSTPSGRMG
jgi:hypothetical protein